MPPLLMFLLMFWGCFVDVFVDACVCFSHVFVSNIALSHQHGILDNIKDWWCRMTRSPKCQLWYEHADKIFIHPDYNDHDGGMTGHVVFPVLFWVTFFIIIHVYVHGMVLFVLWQGWSYGWQGWPYGWQGWSYGSGIRMSSSGVGAHRMGYIPNKDLAQVLRFTNRITKVAQNNTDMCTKESHQQ